MIHPDADQYISVILRITAPEDYGPAAAALARLTRDLADAGLGGRLVLAAAPEHPGRYGHGPAREAAERVFAADSRAAIAQLRAARASGIAPQALAAASMAHLAAAFAPDPIAGYEAMLGCLPRGSGPTDRAVARRVHEVADPSNGYRTVRALHAVPAVADAWAARDAALADYHAVLAAQRDSGTVLRSLLHEHHVRAVGVDPDFERVTGRLARAAALRRLALRGDT